MKREQANEGLKRTRTKCDYQVEVQGSAQNEWLELAHGFADTAQARAYVRGATDLKDRVVRIVAVKYEGVPTLVQRDPVLKF